MTQVELGRLLRRASRTAARLYRWRLAALDLTQRQAATVLALVETPGATLSALAETLGADQPTASALVDRLLGAGLVRRETDAKDRRKARLYPTAEALRLAEALTEARRETESRIREALGPADSAALERLLQGLVESLSADSLDAPRGERRP